MRSNRRAAFVAALMLALASGCVSDLSGIAPYAGHIGKTYRLTYAGEVDCELWPPSAAGGDYVILPFDARLMNAKPKGIQLPEGTLLTLDGARRGQTEDYVLVSLDDPAHKGKRIRASILPRFLEGWPDEGATR
jgi:hypothetical protein